MEKRKKDRAEIENMITFEVVYDVDQKYIGKSYFSLSKNISTGGLQIQTDTLLPIGTLLKIQVLLADTKKTTTLFGKIKWIKKHGDSELYEAGLAFVSQPQKDLLDFIVGISKAKKN